MVISSANAATSSYDVAGQNSKVAISTQNSKITQPQQADLVSLSSESVDAQRKEKYALKTDPVEFYKAWLDTEPRYIYLEGPKPYEDLLPETQTYIDQLNERLKNAKSPEQRQGITAIFCSPLIESCTADIVLSAKIWNFFTRFVLPKYCHNLAVCKF